MVRFAFIVAVAFALPQSWSKSPFSGAPEMLYCIPDKMAGHAGLPVPDTDSQGVDLKRAQVDAPRGSAAVARRRAAPPLMREKELQATDHKL